MRLLTFALNYAPEPSGTAPYTAGFCEYAASIGWGVTAITGVPHYPQWKRQPAPQVEIRNGVRVMRQPHVVPERPSGRGRALMEATFLGSATPQALGRASADAVLGVVPGLSSGVLAATSAQRLGVPLVLWIQDLMSVGADQSGIDVGRSTSQLIGVIEGGVVRRADRVLVPSRGMGDALVAAGADPERIRVVRNWAQLPPPSHPSIEVRKRHGFAADEPIAVHSGNMGSKQGLEVLVEAARLAPSVTFVLQGDGGERPMLEQLGAGMDNVRFLPSLEDNDLSDLLAAADVLVVTQRPSVTTMSVPSKLMNYAAAARPIVGSVDAQSEAAAVLRDFGDHRIVPPGDAEALANAIGESVLSPGESHGGELAAGPRYVALEIAEVVGAT